MEPAEAGRVDRLHEPVRPAGQPLGIEAPEEEPTAEEDHQRQGEDDDRLPGPHPRPQRHAAGEDHERQPKKDGRQQIVAG